jgi:uncharacterized protein (DUF305 family)
MATVNVEPARTLLVLAAFVLGGCSLGSDESAQPVETVEVVQPGAPGQGTRTLTPEEVEDIETTPHTKADIRFMQGMIHHHAQALRMARLVPKRTRQRDINLLAERIDLSQAGEVELMQNWLKARNEAAPELHPVHGHAHGVGQSRAMPGMLSERQLKRLAATRGRAFDRLFLRSMIVHHQGAVKMVADLYVEGGGAELDVGNFARHVESDQQIEIGRMQKLFASLPRVAAKR